MQSFLIISTNPTKRSDYINNLCDKEHISSFDRHLITSEENSFGIAQIRNVQKTASLAPQKGMIKALIFENAQTLTIEAQNALLKLLEEPPRNTDIFLSATTDTIFLPTILSRCKIVILEKEKKEVSQEKKDELQKQIEIMSSDSISLKLVLAEKLAQEKEGIGEWFENMFTLLREEMLKDPENTIFPLLIQNLQEIYQLFQTTNVAPRMLFEHMLLTMSS